MSPQLNIVFTSCQARPIDNISSLKVKPLKKNDSNESISLLLRCFAGSNSISDLFWLVPIHSVSIVLKHEHLRLVGLVILGPKHENFEENI